MVRYATAVLFVLALGQPAIAQVKVTRILDTPKTRVAQVEIPANDTRPLHAHHGFHNPNARTVRWVEFFALKTGNAVALDESAARALALAFARK